MHLSEGPGDCLPRLPIGLRLYEEVNPLQKLSLFGLVAALVVSVAVAPADAGFKRLGASGYTFLKVAQGARSAAMGDAYGAVANDASAVFWNPAGLVYVEDREFTSTYTKWLVNSAFYSGAFAMTTDLGTFAISFIQFVPDEIEETTPFAPGGTGRMLDAGDIAVGFGYAKRLTDRFSLGGHLQYVQEQLDFDSGSTLNFSLGSMFFTGFRSSRIAMTLRNFGKNELIIRDKFLMPMVFSVTGAMEVFGEMQDPNRLTLSYENVFAIDYSNRGHLGGELWLQDIIALRAGYKFNYDTDTFSAGAGIKYPYMGKNIKIDASYTDMGSLFDGALRVSVGLGF
jgi:hypothetical protein